MTKQDLAPIVEEAITGAAGDLAETLSQYQWALLPESQLHAAKMALTKSDYIMKIAAGNQSAVHDALVKSAILGLDLTEGKRQGWLLPRKNQHGDTVIQLQVGYKGVEAIHQRMGVIDRLVIRVVREGDDFDWSGDDQEKPVHKCDWLSADRDKAKPVGAFAITYYPDKTINVTTAPITEIYEKHRDNSDAYKTYIQKTAKGEWTFEPPWVSHEKTMIEKTMAYIAAKQWPANIRDEGQSSKILETLHEVDTADYSYGYTLDQKQAFYSFIEQDDALGMYLFQRRVGIEVYSAITFGQAKDFPKGQKGKLRQKQNDFAETGYRVFMEIERSLEDSDVGRLQENTDGILVVTEKLLLSALDDHQTKKYTELMEAITIEEIPNESE